MHITIVLYPRLTQLDATGPFEVLSRLPETKITLAAATLEPVPSDRGLRIVPNATFETASKCQVLVVPGGRGVDDAILDRHVVDFVHDHGRDAEWVTSVCTGALLLGAAGLLRGYRAATHWTAREFLPAFGAIPAVERVVCDRNRITAGGVTAGIDFGIYLAGQLCGEEIAQQIELELEYDPHPPFRSGSPRTADPALMGRVLASRAEAHQHRADAVAEAAKRMKKR